MDDQPWLEKLAEYKLRSKRSTPKLPNLVVNDLYSVAEVRHAIGTVKTIIKLFSKRVLKDATS